MTVQTDALVRLEGAGVKRGSRWLVREVGLTVSPGEIVTLIGPNGSGKSTTAKMALGLLAPSEGSAAQRVGLRVGYVPQKLAIDWTLPLTVNRFMRLTNRLSDAEAAAALAQTGVLQLRREDMRHLSGGEMQRVMLARAIARKPDLLVLDEPVQGVDHVGEAAIYDLISEIRADLGCGILMISHDLHIVMAAADQVICLNGHVCCRGTPSHVSQSDAYRRLFGVRANGAIAVYQHNHDHVHLPDGRVRHADGTISDSCGSQDHDHAHPHGVGEAEEATERRAGHAG